MNPTFKRALERKLVGLLSMLAVCSVASANIVEDQAKEASQWVDKPTVNKKIEGFSPAAQIIYREYQTPRPLRMWITRIDTAAEGVRMTVTEPADLTGEDSKYEIRCANTLEFARQHGVQLAINASAFGPMRPRLGKPMDIVGLAADRGKIFSEPDKRFGAMYVSKDGRITMHGPPVPTDNVWQAIAGFRMLIDDQVVAVPETEAKSSFGGLNPRTAIGADKEGRVVWLVVVDGRQKGVSEGVTTVELAVLFKSLGAWDALNLDGGGSSTFVLENSDGTHHVINQPGYKEGNIHLREVANSIGFYLPGKHPNIEDNRKPTLRDTVIRLASGRRGGGYKWKGDGVSKDIKYGDKVVLKSNPEGTFCCAATLETFLDAYCMTKYGTDCSRAKGNWFEDWPVDKFMAMQKGWWGTNDAMTNAHIPEESRPTIREKQVYHALPMSNLAEAVDDYHLLQRGDMVMFWRKNGSGHSVIFWGLDRDENGKERMWYWSSQGKPRYAYPKTKGGKPELTAGYGLNWEYVGEDIDPARIYGARLNTPYSR